MLRLDLNIMYVFFTIVSNLTDLFLTNFPKVKNIKRKDSNQDSFTKRPNDLITERNEFGDEFDDVLLNIKSEANSRVESEDDSGHIFGPTSQSDKQDIPNLPRGDRKGPQTLAKNTKGEKVNTDDDPSKILRMATFTLAELMTSEQSQPERDSEISKKPVVTIDGLLDLYRWHLAGNPAVSCQYAFENNESTGRQSIPGERKNDPTFGKFRSLNYGGEMTEKVFKFVAKYVLSS